MAPYTTGDLVKAMLNGLLYLLDFKIILPIIIGIIVIVILNKITKPAKKKNKRTIKK